jgi:hypothetical protein
MNRSILIVICDFLLLSLLTFSTDINRMADENTQPPTKVMVATNAVASTGQDLAAMMKLALAEEQKGQRQLQQELATARASAEQQQAQLTGRAQENARLQQQQSALQQKLTAAQASMESLNRELQNSSTTAQMSQQKLAATETEAQKQADLAAILKSQLDELIQSNRLAQTEQQRLAGQLQLAEVERSAAADRATLMQQEVQATRAENAKLASGLTTLATNSSQLTQEIRSNRALAPNALFSEFLSNRVAADILAARTGFLGRDASKDRQAQTILVTDGTNIFALCHIQDTPLTLWDPGTEWEGLTGTLTGHGAPVPIHSLSFDQKDPRVVMMPVTAAEAKQLGSRVYPISSDPYKFQDAVLIGAGGDYYGQCNFQIDTSTPQYVKLDRNLLGGLFGKFNPSRGDVVLSRGGEFLGIMVNGTYCLMIHDFPHAYTFQFGPDVRSQHTGTILTVLYDDVFQFPLRLQ